MALNKTLKLSDPKLRWGAVEAMDALTQQGTSWQSHRYCKSFRQGRRVRIMKTLTPPQIVVEEMKDEPKITAESDSDYQSYSDCGIPPSLRRKGLGGKKMAKADMLVAARLLENRSKDQINARAKKLKQHYKEVEDGDKIFGYGFLIILLLLTGFYWFILIFSKEMRDTFHETQLLAPLFGLGTISLALLNIIVR